MRLAPLSPSPRRLCLHLLATGVILMAAGCGTTTGTAGEEAYLPPGGGTPVAYVKGTRLGEDGIFQSSHLGFVSMVDLKPVADAVDHWDEPLAVTPGPHTIAVEYRYSNLMSRAYLPLNARAGVTYQVMIEHGREATEDRRLFSDIWLVDSTTGKSVTAIYHRQVTGGKKGTIFYMNK